MLWYMLHENMWRSPRQMSNIGRWKPAWRVCPYIYRQREAFKSFWLWDEEIIRLLISDRTLTFEKTENNSNEQNPENYSLSLPHTLASQLSCGIIFYSNMPSTSTSSKNTSKLTHRSFQPERSGSRAKCTYCQHAVVHFGWYLATDEDLFPTLMEFAAEWAPRTDHSLDSFKCVVKDFALPGLT